MNFSKLILCFFVLLFLSFSSCEDEPYLCETVSCFNGGRCEDGECFCVDGYFGNNCQNLDLTKIAQLLKAGESPKNLFDLGISLDSLYGKEYEGGFIFYLDTENGTGMLAALTDAPSCHEWGVELNNTEVPNVNAPPPVSGGEIGAGARFGDGSNNTTIIIENKVEEEDEATSAAEYCGTFINGKYEDWFLPSREELNLMFTNLRQSKTGDFLADSYWSSSEGEFGGDFFGWSQNFEGGEVSASSKVECFSVRAVRKFKE